MGTLVAGAHSLEEHQRLTTPYGFHTTSDEVLMDVDLAGKRAVVTGGSSGIGAETARALAGAGAEVTLAVRDVPAGNRVAREIIAKTGNAKVTAAPLELTDRASVASFVDAWQGPLHIVVNNAGIMALPSLHRAAEGWELQFATNCTPRRSPTAGCGCGWCRDYFPPCGLPRGSTRYPVPANAGYAGKITMPPEESQ